MIPKGIYFSILIKIKSNLSVKDVIIQIAALADSLPNTNDDFFPRMSHIPSMLVFSLISNAANFIMVIQYRNNNRFLNVTYILLKLSYHVVCRTKFKE